MDVFPVSIILIIIWLITNHSGGRYSACNLIVNNFIGCGNSVAILEVESTKLAVILAEKRRVSFVEDILLEVTWIIQDALTKDAWAHR